MYLSRDFTRSKRHRTCEGEVFHGWRGIQNEPYEMLFWIWSSVLADGPSSYTIKFLFGAIPMKLLPTKDLRRLANERMVDVIRWDLESLLSGDIPGSRPLRAAIRRTLAVLAKLEPR